MAEPAITEDETHLVYEMLQIPNAASVLNVNGDYGVGSRFQNHAVLTAKTSIDALLAALGDAQIRRLREILAEWKKASTDAVVIEPQGENEGVSINPARKRRLLRARLRLIVPVLVEAQHTGGALPLG